MKVIDTIVRNWAPQGVLSHEVVCLFTLFGREFSARDLVSANDESQQWLRTPGKERWQVPEAEVADLAEFERLATALGLVDPVVPATVKEKWAVVLGATAKAMLHRLSWFAVQEGMEYEELIVLTSQRPAIATELELMGKVGVGGLTEREAALWVCSQVCLPLSVSSISVLCALEPKATTEQTVEMLMRGHDVMPPAVFVSHQPFGLRQSLSAYRALSQGGHLERGMKPDFVIAPGLSTLAESRTRLLDEACRLIYELVQLKRDQPMFFN